MKYQPLAVLAFLLVVGCGGGGGGSTPTPTPTPVSTNSAPVVSQANAAQSALMGYAFDYDTTQAGTVFSDPDSDTLTYDVSISSTEFGLSVSGTNIVGTPNSVGEVLVTVTASDPDAASVVDQFSIAISIDQSAILSRFEGAIDLASLANYADQPVPSYIRPEFDDGNPITDPVATIGRVLFYDTQLSIDNTVSCATCHQQDHGFSDPDIVSTGVEGGKTRRHSMRLINTRFGPERRMFWDERAEDLEDQVLQPIQDHAEMGFSGESGRPSLNDLLVRLEELEYYEELFRFAYLDADITPERISEALAQFVKSIQSFDSAFDTGRAQVNEDNVPFPNYTDDENAGKSLFLNGPGNPAGGAGCARCHRPPEFSIDPNSDMNGAFGEANDVLGFDLTNTRATSLRDLAAPDETPNGGFMHDGSLATIRAVIDHYDRIQPPANEPPLSDWFSAIDNRLLANNNNATRPLDLTNQEKDELEAFLRTLTGRSVYTDPKWSDPFPG